MKKIVHLSETRGKADHGWLHSRHTFSFGGYQHPERTRFGLLRVLNDDVVASGGGFGTHPHDNMEIVSIPLQGALEHKDSMGNVQLIRKGDVQIMSAGTGLSHSEYNHSTEAEVHFLQIWVLPEIRNIEPQYQQVTVDESLLHNRLQQVVAPVADAHSVQIHQQAWFHLGQLDAGASVTYTLHDPGHGVYLFLIDGEVEAAGELMRSRDGLGLQETKDVTIQALQPSRILLMEVPMR
jgi:hypothetical protein